MSKKNFAYPLAISGSEQELKSLIPELEKLGYKLTPGLGNIYDLGDGLATSYADNIGKYGFTEEPDNPDRIAVPASNPQLVLALAAMTTGDEFYLGEWVVVLEDYHPGLEFTEGKLYQVRSYGTHYKSGVEIVRDDKGSTDNGWNSKFFRKATKEEIIDHFKPKAEAPTTRPFEKLINDYISGIDPVTAGAYTLLSTNRRLGKSFFASTVGDMEMSPIWIKEYASVKSKPMTTKYKLKKRYPGSPSAGVTFNYDKQADNYHYSFGILQYTVSNNEITNTEFFEPIPDEVKEYITLRCAGGTFEIEVSKKGIYYKHDDAYLSPIGLNEIIEGLDTQLGKMNRPGVYPFKVTHIDSGCKKQVPVEDWRKVLDAYDRLK